MAVLDDLLELCDGALKAAETLYGAARRGVRAKVFDPEHGLGAVLDDVEFDVGHEAGGASEEEPRWASG